MTTISTSIFERPRLAAGRLMDLDPEGFVRAVLSPDSLSPAERETLSDKYGVKGAGGLHTMALRLIENPIVLWGAVMAFKYPLPLAKEMFRFAPHLTGKLRKIGWVTRAISGVDDLYAGTPIPEIYKAILRDVDLFKRDFGDSFARPIVAYMKKGNKFGRREQVLLAAKLDGLDNPAAPGMTILKPIRLGPDFDEMVVGVRKVYDQVWDRIFGTVEHRARLLAASEHNLSKKSLAKLDRLKKEGMLDELQKAQLAKVSSSQGRITREILGQLEAAGIDTSQFSQRIQAGILKKEPFYHPHKVARRLGEFEEQTTELLKATTEPSRARRIADEAVAVGTEHGVPRLGRMVPDPEDLTYIKDYLRSPKTLKHLQNATGGGARAYSLKFMEVLPSYLHSLARVDTWTMKGNGQKLINAVKDLMQEGPPGSPYAPHTALHTSNVIRGRMMLDSYIPHALGKQTFKQMMANAKWAQTKLGLAEQMGSAKVAEAFKRVPGGDKVYETALGFLRDDRGISSLKNVSGRAASYMYLTTLGLNPVSSVWNLMQTILTTVPTIGPKYTYRGLQSVFKKVPKYFKARQSGLSHEQALTKVFPHFHEEGMLAAPLTDEAVLRSLNRSWESVGSLPLGGEKAEKVKAGLMSFFTASENIVRLTAFEGGMAKATAEGLPLKAAREFGRRVTETTQFLGGPANVPAMMRDWNPILRQFGSFPFRTANYLINPATQMGSGAQAGFLGRNWGTLGRVMLSSGVAYEAGKELLDADISHGLVWGALPMPQPGRPLGELPFVPPVVSLGAGAVGDLMSGEFRHTRRSLPILVPGGLAAARLAPILGEGVAEPLGRGYADYSAQLGDGRIPTYTSKGQLRGYYTPTQVWMEALGIPPGGPEGGRKEQELNRYLLAQRDRIRGYRKEFLEAIADNDTNRAREIQEEYEQVYPGLGGLQAKPNDLRAIHLRRMVPRLERVLESLPADVRPMFAQVIQATLLEQAESLIGVDPYLLQASPTIRSREPWRPAPPGDVIESLYRRQIDNRQMVSRGPVGQTQYGSQQQARYGRRTQAMLRRRDSVLSPRRTPAFSGF